MRNTLLNETLERALTLPLPANIFVKNLQGEFVACNDRVIEQLNFVSKKDLIGRTDFTVPIPKRDAALYTKEDKRVLTQKQIGVYEEKNCTFPQGKMDLFTLKFPILDKDDHPMGLFGFSFYHTGNFINPANTMLNSQNYVLAFEIQKRMSNPFQLTQRQLDCLFYLVKGMTLKMISKEMQLSPRTIEHYLENIKNKLQCDNRVKLIEKALQMDYIKTRLFQK